MISLLINLLSIQFILYLILNFENDKIKELNEIDAECVNEPIPEFTYDYLHVSTVFILVLALVMFSI